MWTKRGQEKERNDWIIGIKHQDEGGVGGFFHRCLLCVCVSMNAVGDTAEQRASSDKYQEADLTDLTDCSMLQN